MTRMLMAGLLAAGLSTGLAVQRSKPVTYDVTVHAEGVAYTGTMTLVAKGEKVSGTIEITQPTAVTGKPEGTLKDRALSLDFAYHMTERNCDGRIAVNVTMPEKPGEAKGTVSIVGCGRDEANRLSGTIEMRPSKS